MKKKIHLIWVLSLLWCLNVDVRLHLFYSTSTSTRLLHIVPQDIFILFRLWIHTLTLFFLYFFYSNVLPLRYILYSCFRNTGPKRTHTASEPDKPCRDRQL
ncbi:hypothetical protein AMECASPLE_015390 [Ameca splendens]|uniref:Secreted peptide n=1 Tax=Ameca splendens TaxID=208324 RepID=A0ABV0ZLZ3_9TELE